MSTHRLVHGEGRLRVTPWRGDDHTAYLVATRGRPAAPDIEAVVRDLSRQGYRAAVTAALSPSERAPFLQAGFEEHERLHLLSRAIDDVPETSVANAQLRRSRRRDRASIVALDATAFTHFWHFDGPGLDDAMAATPSARLRVAVDRSDDERIIGYAVTGRAASRGYLQRLAVDPEHQRRGIGSALVADSMRWLRRWGAREVLVNTQESNEPALALYEALGFRRQRHGLAVLRRSIGTTPE